MNKGFFFILILFFCLKSYSQNNVTARISLKTGGSIDFIFNSFGKFQSGVDIIDRTEVEIYFNDTIAGGGPYGSSNGWVLEAEAESDKIYSYFGTNFLDLDVIDITSTYNHAGTDYSKADVELIYGSASTIAEYQATHTVVAAKESIYLSFEASSDNSATTNLSTKSNGYYTVIIILTLRAK